MNNRDDYFIQPEESIIFLNTNNVTKGGPGSGNRGHAGRPGQRGGSAPKGVGGPVTEAPKPTPAPAPVPTPVVESPPPAQPQVSGVPGARIFTPLNSPPAGPKPTAFRKAENIEQAQQFARDMGVQIMDYGAELPKNLEAANRLNEAMFNLQQQGYPVPTAIGVSAAYFQRGKARQADGWYATSNDMIAIRTGGFLGSGSIREERIKEQHANGWWSSGDKLHIENHELGHQAHFKNDPVNFRSIKNMRISPAIKSVMGQVSRYATKNPLEFVAETFAGHHGGRKYSKEVYELYDIFRGPKLGV